MLRPLLLLLSTLIAALAAAQSPPPATGFTLDNGKPSGGASATGGGPPPTYYVDSDGWYDGTSNGVQADKCSGQVTWAWTWQGPGDAPASVVLKVEGRAQWSSPSGGCDDGLGQSDPYTNSMAGPTLIGQSQSGVKYVVASVSGNAVSFQITPSASATYGTCSVGTRVTLTPVTISITGTKLVSGSLESLIGLKQVASISAGGYELHGHNWSVGGDVQPFGRVVEGTSRSSPDFPGQSSLDEREYDTALVYPDSQTTDPHKTVQFYASKPGIENVTCSCSVYLPGSSSAFGTVSGQLNVTVLEPSNYFDVRRPSGATGTYFDDPTRTNPSKIISSSPQAVIMEFWADTPSPFDAEDGDGSVAVCQLILENTIITPNIHYGMKEYWLDNVFPYSAQPSANGPMRVDQDRSHDKPYSDEDTPDYDVPSNATKMEINMDFITSNIYCPAGGVYVPIKTKIWTWTTESTKDAASGIWSVPSGGVSVSSSAPTMYWLKAAEWGRVFLNSQNNNYPTP